MALKWGFACAGKIAHDYLNAMGTLNEGEHEVVAIADPFFVQAKSLAEQFQIPKAYDNFLELAQDPNVEVVHVAALNPKHFEVAMLMLQHGKHVLVQKPMCMNEKQARKLIAYAKEKNLFLMEGIWSRVFPTYQYIRKQIDSGVFGEILSVEVDFGNADMANVDRATKNALGGGSVLDLGVYNIQFCQFIFREEPKSIKATGTLNDDGVDLEMSAVLNYSGNKVGKIRSSLVETLSNTAKIIGTKGTMIVPSFWTPTSIIDVDGQEKTFPQTAVAKHEFFYKNSIGLRYEPEEVRKCIRAGKKESDNVSHKESLTLARIEDEIRRQIGVKYAADNE